MAVDFLINATKNDAEGYRRTLFNGLDERENYPVKPSHFIPYNQWKIEKGALYITDKSNGDEYFNDSPNVKRLKCLGLLATTPIVHAVSTLLNLANRITKLVTFAHFWHYETRHWSFQAKILATVKICYASFFHRSFI